MNWKLNSNLTAMSIVAAILILAGGTVVGAYHSFKHLGWIAVFPVAGFLFADYMGAHLIFFSHQEKGLLGWSALVCKFLIFGTLLLNGASLVYLLITESKDRAVTAGKLEAEKARAEIETAAKVKLIEAESEARRAEEAQRAENAAKLLAATGNARLARAVTTTRPAQQITFDVTPLPAPSPTPAPDEEEAKDDPSTFERFIRWYTRAPLYFSGGLVGLICFVLMQTFGKLAADRKGRNAFPSEIDLDVEKRSSSRRADFALAPKKSTTHVSSKNDDTGTDKGTTHVSFDEGLKQLRETLKLISFHTPGQHFKTDVKEDCVWIRSMTSDHGVQRTASSVRAKLDILDDAITMVPDAFHERLEKFLRSNGFEI